MPKEFSLYDRFVHQGTLADPEGIPDPVYSLPATLNWMRSLAILVDAKGINAETMKTHFGATQRGQLNDQAINTVYEQLLMSLHHLASIRNMGSLDRRIDTARSAIVTWYYGVYHAASAMIAAQQSAHHDTHAETANAWDRQFATGGLIPEPFVYRVDTLVQKDVKAQINALRSGNSYALEASPSTRDEAFGACMSYLQGSAKWRSEYIEEELKRKDLKKLGLDSFRSKVAQEIRDDRLRGKGYGFVHQAFRYRGKANYREALFISYGSKVEDQLIRYYPDLEKVLTAFLCVAGAFCAKRLGKEAWNLYYTDLDSSTSFCIKPNDVWCSL